MEEMLKMIDTYNNTSPFIVADKGYVINDLIVYTLIDIELEPRHKLEQVTLGLIKEVDESRYPTERTPKAGLYKGMYMEKPDFEIEVKNYRMEKPIIMSIKLEKATILKPKLKIYYPIIKYVNCHFSSVEFDEVLGFRDYITCDKCTWRT